jgi:nucleoside phosphorylase
LEGFVRTIVRSALAFGVISGSLVAPARSAAEPLPVLILSAFPTEQAVLLEAAKPVTEVGVFNGRRFFSGTIAGKSVVLGLTGIGMVNADTTTRAVLDIIPVGAIIFSGVAGASHNIGDVMIPHDWTDGTDTYPVDSGMYSIAAGLVCRVTLDPCLPVEDVTCTGQRPPLRTPICIANGAPPQIHVGGLGASSDPFGGRAVPCLSSAGNLLGCEACGAPLNTSPGVAEFISGAAPFADPNFYLALFQSFAPGPGNDQIVVVDEETAAVARIAKGRTIPFIAFRALSDSSAADRGGDPLMLPGFPVTFFFYAQLAADNAAAVALEFLARWSP